MVAQALLPVGALNQVKSLASNAFLKVPDAGGAEQAFVSIKQGAGEPYVQFIDRLKNAWW